MKKTSMGKKLVLLLLVFCMIFAAVPVSAASTQKADKALKTAVNKAVGRSKVKSTDSKKAAIKKVFNYATKNFGYARAPLGFKPDSTKDWALSYAKEMLKNKKGSCYHDAAAFAFLAKKVSGYDVRIGYGQAKVYSSNYQLHAWVEVKIGKTWYVYDTNANRFSTLRKGKWYQQKRTSVTKVYNFKTAKYINVEI